MKIKCKFKIFTKLLMNLMLKIMNKSNKKVIKCHQIIIIHLHNKMIKKWYFNYHLLL